MFVSERRIRGGSDRGSVLHLTSAKKCICGQCDRGVPATLQLQECPIVLAQGFVVLELILLDCLHHENHMVFQRELEKLPLSQPVPGSQSKKSMCSLTSPSSKWPPQSTGTPLPFLPSLAHSCRASSLFPGLHAAMGRALFILICSIKFPSFIPI